jgi:heme-degrading monooxygenase HmoA
MIARHWRGWTKPEDADAYESLLRDTVLPHIRQIAGHRGVNVLRSDGPEESEFIVINFFDSLEAVKRFAGPDYQVATFEPEARRLLSRVEPLARHYAVPIAQAPES